MTSFDFRGMVSDLFKKYKDGQIKVNKHIGLIILLGDYSKKQEIILSRWFLRDKDQMNRGFENFYKEKYHIFLSTTL